jgi:class 3 adenylate cyclase/predicted ATPase
LDPEDFREVIRAYQETCAEVIQRFDGHIAQYLGDGLLVYFGYPHAHEDDAQRAVYTGLDIVSAMQVLNARLVQKYKVELFARIGIHTGQAVVGEVGSGRRREQLALGETPNIAARLQSFAAPNTVLISVTTFQLVQGLFLWHPLGECTIPGITRPLAVYEVRGASKARNRFEVAVSTGLVSLVGRDVEMRLLLQLWEEVQHGKGYTVLLRGEAGIGKSRLVQELKAQLGQAGITGVQFQCSSYYQHSALYPAIECLQRLSGWHSQDSPQERLDKLEGMLRQYHFASPEVITLFARLLSLPAERYPALYLSSQRQKQKTQEALLDWLREETERQPVLVIWEDVHWADPSSVELLTLFLNRPPTARLLVLLTYRPEFREPWSAQAHLVRITLERLAPSQAIQMIEQLARGKPLPDDMVAQLVGQTDGIPLFIEELTKTVLGSELLREVDGRYELTRPLRQLAIPSTLQDSLMSRLDRLSTGREVAQLGSILGREFSYELIRVVWPHGEEMLQRGLQQLSEAELIYQSGVPPHTHCGFKHVLIQETAYQSLLRSTRQHYHRQVAHALAERFPEVATTPELLAYHYTEAGLGEQAVPYWQRAGERAIQRSAHVEAIQHLTKGLEVLKTLPQTPEHIQQELTLHIALGAPLIATKGFAAAEVGHTYSRARELCQQIGDTPQMLKVLMGLWMYYAVRAELHTAHELSQQLLSLSERQHDPAMGLEACQAMGITLSMCGELVLARPHFERGLALYDPQKHGTHPFLYGQDSQVVCLCHVALVLWLLGYPEQARQRSHEALHRARELVHPYSLAWTLFYASMLHTLRREVHDAHIHAEALQALCREQRFSYRLVQGTIVRSWALTQQQDATAIAQLNQGLEAIQTTGAEVYRPYFLALLAEALGSMEQPEEALQVLTEAQAHVERTGERFYEAELSRLKGELLLGLAGGKHREAEHCLQQALTTARRQQAKSWELRAAVSLSRLWQRQGKHRIARELLAESYDWFTEGFDTADLQEAKRLLVQLA